MRIQLLGDLSLNGNFCDPQHHQIVAGNLSALTASLPGCDLRIANWESPLWGDGKVNGDKHPRLCTTMSAAMTALPLDLDVVLLANNHAYDCREKGFENSIRFFEENGVYWLGAGRTEKEASQPAIITRGMTKIGILNYVGRETNPCLPPNSRVFLNWLEADRAVREIRQLREQADAVIVAVHWGRIERVRFPDAWQRDLARRMIDAGASVVAGAHAHCLQGDEDWQHGHIFYSLGNFLFGQVASPGMHGRPVPKLCCEVGIATCSLSGQTVTDVAWTFLRQQELLLVPDGRRCRHLKQERISKVVSGPLARLRRYLHWEEKVALPWRQFLANSGGFVPGLRRIRLRHAEVVFRALIPDLTTLSNRVRPPR